MTASETIREFIETERAPNDELADCALKQLHGLERLVAEQSRKGERRGREIVNLLDKLERLKHEIGRLERLLGWVYRTRASDYREVIARTIPQHLKRHGLRADVDPLRAEDEDA